MVMFSHWIISTPASITCAGALLGSNLPHSLDPPHLTLGAYHADPEDTPQPSPEASTFRLSATGAGIGPWTGNGAGFGGFCILETSYLGDGPRWPPGPRSVVTPLTLPRICPTGLVPPFGNFTSPSSRDRGHAIAIPLSPRPPAGIHQTHSWRKTRSGLAGRATPPFTGGPSQLKTQGHRWGETPSGT